MECYTVGFIKTIFESRVMIRNIFWPKPVFQSVAAICAALSFLIVPVGLEVRADQPADNETVEQNEGEAKRNPFFENLLTPERSVQRRFDQAERFIQADRMAEAAQLLGAILENSADYFIPPPVPFKLLPQNPEATVEQQANAPGTATPIAMSIKKLAPETEKQLRTTRQSFSDLVLARLQGLTPQARESYSMQYEAQANRLLQNAVDRASLEALQTVARKYFPTSAGATANFLIGMDQFEKGDWKAALLTFQRLETIRPRKTEDLIRCEPLLSLTLADCQLRAGRADDARTTVERFLKRCPNPEILFAGEQWKPRSADEVLDKLHQIQNLSSQPSAAAWLEHIGWLQTGGISSQNPQTQAGLPFLDLIWWHPSLGAPMLESELAQLSRLVRQADETYIPAPQPLLVQNILISRGIGETTAIDTRTGKRLWNVFEQEYQTYPGIQQYHMPSFRRILAAAPTSHRFALRTFFWHDRIVHQMSSDGNRVFLVEGLNPLPEASFPAWNRARRNITIGKKSVEDPRHRPGNTLVARDVKTGRILWQVGKHPYAQKMLDQLAEEFEQYQQERQRERQAKKKADDSNDNAEQRDKNAARQDKPISELFSDEELFLSETWFLGAPLLLQGRLYVIGENASVLRLIVLDAKTGKMLAQQPLSQVQTAFEADWLRRYYGLMPSASGGIVVCPTSTGLVFAFDAATLSPLWCFSYFTPSDESVEQQNRFANNRFFQFQKSGDNEEFRRMFEKSAWQVPCIMIDDNRVLIAPHDTPALYCLDLISGELLWKNEHFDRNNALFVACIWKNTAFVLTPFSLAAYSMEDGRPVWVGVLQNKVSHQLGAPFQYAVQRSSEFPDFYRKSQEEIAETDSAQTLPFLLFGDSRRPAGQGVHNGRQYYLPFDDGSIGMIDLEACNIEFLHPGQALPKSTDQAMSASPEIEATAAPSDANDAKHHSWSTGDFSLGNLIGLKEHFYAQSPLGVSAFDQWEALRKRVRDLLANEPNEPQALIQQGRISIAEGDIPRAIEYFRRSMQTRQTELAANYLRNILLDAIRSDYATWKEYATELESLAEFPEEYGEILFALASGAIRQAQSDIFIDVLKKTIRLELNHSIQVVVDDDLTCQLHRALGALLKRADIIIAESNERERFLRDIESFSRELFEHFSSQESVRRFLPELCFFNTPVGAGKHLLIRPWWEHDTPLSDEEIHRWRLFIELFDAFPATEQAKKQLSDLYERNQLCSAFELAARPPLVRDLPSPSLSKQQTQPKDAGETPQIRLDNAHSNLSLTSPPDRLRHPDQLNPPLETMVRLVHMLDSRKNYFGLDYYLNLLNKLYGQPGRNACQPWIDTPEIKKFRQRESQAVDWPVGETLLEEGDSGSDLLRTDRPNPHGWNVTRLLQRVQSRGTQVTVPYLGRFEPFFSSYNYSLEISYGENFHLVCCDALGAERWRFNLSPHMPDISDYGYFSDNHYNYKQGIGSQNIFLTGCNHILIFVRGNALVALDVFGADEQGTPGCLWTKKLSAPLSAHQVYSSTPLHNLSSSHQAASHSGGEQGETFLISNNIVCYRDTEKLIGLDPISGQTVWTRQLPSDRCSIVGDREHLFLVFPGLSKVQALNPASGQILCQGRLPLMSPFLSYETNLVFIKQNSGEKRPFELVVGDLRDILDAGRPTDVPSNATTGPSDMATYTIQNELAGHSLVRPVFDGQALAIFCVDTKRLRIYDLKTKQDLLGTTDANGRQGIDLSRLLLPDEKLRSHECDVDVELFDGKYLVYLTKRRNVDMSQKNLIENGTPFRRHLGVIANIPCRGVGAGALMLYEPDGKESWKKPTQIKDWFRLLNTPSQCPIVLYGLAVTDQEKESVVHYMTGLQAIDKKTGEKRFEKLIPPLPGQGQTALQGFRVLVEPEKREIFFSTQNRMVVAKFLDQAPTKTSPKTSVNPPPVLKPKWNISAPLRLFGN